MPQPAVEQASPERFGDYLVYEQLGRGGMATVHRAEKPQRNGPPKQVALKRLIPTTDRARVALFVDEGRLLKYLDHPNIATTYESGKLFGTHFIAMEYVRGPTLKELVARCGTTVGAVPEPITVDIAAQLLAALDHAHNRTDPTGQPLGIIHRDVTPGNIILSDAGVVKLIDFGLAKASVTKEETNTIKGKFGYVAPEYLDGSLDHRADLWAVGIIMYELLTSRRLFDGTDAYDTVMRIKSLPIPRPSRANPRVTPALDLVVMRALDRDRSQRWQSAAEMRAALADVTAASEFKIERSHVAEWASWLQSLPPGTEASGMSHLARMVRPKVVATTLPAPAKEPENVVPDPTTAMPASRSALVWYVGAGLLALFVAIAIVWSLAS
jgi:serine/threonine-protein kinase